MTGILDLIDNAIDDYTSPDAMRWAPEPSDPGQTVHSALGPDGVYRFEVGLRLATVRYDSGAAPGVESWEITMGPSELITFPPLPKWAKYGWPHGPRRRRLSAMRRAYRARRR